MSEIIPVTGYVAIYSVEGAKGPVSTTRPVVAAWTDGRKTAALVLSIGGELVAVDDPRLNGMFSGVLPEPISVCGCS